MLWALLTGVLRRFLLSNRASANGHSRQLAVAKSHLLPPLAECMRAKRWAYTLPHRGNCDMCCVNLLQAVATCYAGTAREFSPYSERAYPLEVLGTTATMAIGAR
jgi:hypothetical protein